MKADIGNSVIRLQSLWIRLILVMTVVLAVTFGLLAVKRFQAAEASWEGYAQRNIAIGRSLANLDRDIGYGGFIHDFKNLVLRRDLQAYQPLVQRDLSRLALDLDQLSNELTAPADTAALSTLRTTVATYASKFRLIPQLLADGKSSAEIDAIVNVPNTAALAAIDQLSTRHILRSGEVKQHARILEANALLFLKLGGALILAAFLVAAAMMIRFQKRLVAANNAKRTFLASMSHEIRTPMNAILGLSYLLEKANLPTESHDLAHKIGAAGRSLLTIINDILDFSKIEAGRLEIEQAPFHLGDVLDNLASIMSAHASGKNLELVIAPPPTGDYYLRGDALRLGQVLINLIGNAIKFTDQGHVEMAISVVAETEQQVSLRFAVRDTGIGISPEQQKEIFAPFSQADTTITRRFGGTGLGLSISRRLVAMMGGKLGVISALGRGSEFWFTMNFEQLPPTRLSAPEMAHLDVLIADDNPIALEALRGIVVGIGWTVTAVDSGEKALQHALLPHVAQGSKKVLIFDWQMPGMDGLAAASAIQAALPGRLDPLVIMVTAFSQGELLSHPDSAIVDAVLTKPVTPSGLYTAVARAQQKRYGNVSIASPASGARLTGIRVLVVDDSEINREVAQRILASEGARVVLANDGQQAVDWLGDHPGKIDIVLMDLQMPVLDGYEAARQIRHTLRLADLPVVALTAGAFKEQQDAAKAAGMTDYISKPFDVDAAIELIRRYAGQGHPEESVGRSVPDSLAAAVADLPGLAVERGLVTWKSAEVYRQYLRKFARDYGDCVREMTQAEQMAAATLAHKLTGAAGNLALTDVAARAADAVRVLRAGEDPAAAFGQLKRSMATALESIHRYAPVDNPADGNQNLTVDTVQVAQLLGRLLAAFNTDDPEAVRPVLAALGEALPPDRLAAINSTCENFEFRSGEAATRKLAAALGIALDD